MSSAIATVFRRGIGKSRSKNFKVNLRSTVVVLVISILLIAITWELCAVSYRYLTSSIAKYIGEKIGQNSNWTMPGIYEIGKAQKSKLLANHWFASQLSYVGNDGSAFLKSLQIVSILLLSAMFIFMVYVALRSLINLEEVLRKQYCKKNKIKFRPLRKAFLDWMGIDFHPLKSAKENFLNWLGLEIVEEVK